MSFIDSVKSFFLRYIDFETRSSRSEYWWSILFYTLAVTVLGLTWVAVSALSGGSVETGEWGVLEIIAITPLVLFALAAIIPMLAVTVRRFHDLNQTGWLVLVFNLLGVIPFIGTLISIGQIIWFCFPGTKGPNKYGYDPLGNAEADVFD